MRKLILILFLSVPFLCKAQVLLSDIDYQRLDNIEAREYLENQIHSNIYSFADNQASLGPSEETSGYKKHTLYFYFKASPGEILLNYINTSPTEAWNIKKARLNLCFSKKENTLFYPDDFIERLDTGQLIYLNLHFLFGLYRTAMAFEITRIDEENKLIEFSYLKGNPAEGKQVLRFHETSNGKTILDHTSYFKSKSLLRDRLLYPHFHKKVLNDFHRNMWRRIEDQD